LKVEVKNKIVFGLWLFIALSVLVLFVAAFQKRKTGLCVGVHIEISTNNQNYFITQKEINEVVNVGGMISEKEVKSIDIAALESAMEKNPWVKNAEIYFENNSTLHIDVEQRIPIARLYSVNGNSTYIDSEALRLPIKNNASARVLIVTNFPSDNDVLAHTDSMLLNQTKEVANFIYRDSFWNAQIAQVDITTSGKFELVPVIGNHTIVLGNADNLKEKFARLYTFYTKAWLQNGVNTYSTIDIRFDNQVVATRKSNLYNRLDSTLKPLVSLDSVDLISNDSLLKIR
jgi:cell division protein FtsQ